jgi:DNA-binding NtrC family response regulator
MSLFKQEMDRYAKEFIEQALRNHGGNRSHTARYLGMSRRGLLNKIKDLEIEIPSSRKPDVILTPFTTNEAVPND